MAAKSIDRLIEINQDVVGGKPRIAGRRISVEDIVVWHEWMGLSADQIASEYSLSLAEIYAALTYYHDNRRKIDRSIKDGEKFVEALRRQYPSKVTRKINASKN